MNFPNRIFVTINVLDKFMEFSYSATRWLFVSRAKFDPEKVARIDCTRSRQKGRGRARRWLFCLWEVDCAVWFRRSWWYPCARWNARSHGGLGSRSRALGYVTRTAGVSSLSTAGRFDDAQAGLDPVVSALVGSSSRNIRPMEPEFVRARDDICPWNRWNRSLLATRRTNTVLWPKIIY